jgi:hypothetical protein
MIYGLPNNVDAYTWMPLSTTSLLFLHVEGE